MLVYTVYEKSTSKLHLNVYNVDENKTFTE